jgi:hypothetical protein
MAFQGGVDRSQFTVNPTNCAPQKVTSVLTSATGQSARPSSPFTATNCAKLGFKPSLALSFKGAMKRTGNPTISATLRAAKGEANVAATTVVLPRGEFIDNTHINNPRIRVQFNEDKCPPKSVLGKGNGLLAAPRQAAHRAGLLPLERRRTELSDLVADLNGQIHVILVGSFDSVKKKGSEQSRVRTRFLSVPDAPVSRFDIKLFGGKRGLIENSENLCQRKPSVTVKMTGQNGKPLNSEPKVGLSCGGGKKKGAKSKKNAG